MNLFRGNAAYSEAALESAPTHTSQSRSAVRSLRILVVDNVADAADTLAQLLKLWGHEAEVAYGGLQALAAASRFQPEVLLLDLGLPGISGFEVARRVRETCTTQPLVIAITGYAEDIYRETAKQAGFSEYLIKPIDPSLLRTRLQELTDGAVLRSVELP